MPSEAAVKKHFRANKRLLVAAVGRGPMDDTKINEIGKLEFGDRWAGVFPSDKAKKLLQMRDRFVDWNYGYIGLRKSGTILIRHSKLVVIAYVPG